MHTPAVVWFVGWIILHLQPVDAHQLQLMAAKTSTTRQLLNQHDPCLVKLLAMTFQSYNDLI